LLETLPDGLWREDDPTSDTAVRDEGRWTADMTMMAKFKPWFSHYHNDCFHKIRKRLGNQENSLKGEAKG
jgi:hypothetical protein